MKSENLTGEIARDWLSVVFFKDSNPDKEILRKTLNTALSVDSDDVAQMLAEQEAIAAAEIVALLNGHPESSTMDEWIIDWARQEQDSLDQSLIDLSIEVVKKISTDSALRNSVIEFETATYLKEWQHWQKVLLGRLKADMAEL